MDITVNVADYVLNIRTTGLIIHNNKVLVHINKNSNHICLPGGRITIGENSKDAVKRELEEEIGKPVEIGEYVTTIENFFKLKDKKYHEIMFVYKAEFKDEQDKKIEEPLENIEGKEYLQYDWVEISKLEDYNMLPKRLKEVLQEKEYPRNVINIDAN